MKILLAIASIIAAIALPARAQDIEIGTGPICGTQKQVERIVTLLEKDARAAIRTVNAEEGDPAACAVLTIGYLRGTRLSTAQNKVGTYHVVRILIVGVVKDGTYQATAPGIFVTLFKVEEYDA